MIDAAGVLSGAALHHLWQCALIAAASIAMFAVVKSARTRAWMLTGAFALAALAPLAAFAPGVGLADFAQWRVERSMPVYLSDPARISTTNADIARAPAHDAAMALQRELGAYSRPPILHWAAAAFVALWFAGAAAGLVRLGRAWRRALRLKQRAAPHASGIRRARLRLSSEIGAPMVVGVFRPVILAPKNWEDNMTDTERLSILRHEEAHIERRDPLICFMQRALTALFWWNPALRWLGARLDVERERACDEVAAETSSARCYARALLDGSKAAVRTHAPLLAVGAFGAQAQIESRIRRLSDPNYADEARVTRTGALLATLAVTASALALLAFTPRAAWAQNEHSPHEDGRVHEDAHDGHAAFEPDVSTAEHVLGRALVETASDGDVANVAGLLEAGAPIDYAVDGDGTALIQAARHGDLQMTNYLLAHGAEPSAASPGDGDPLIQAARMGHLHIATRLLEAGADATAYVEGDETPLIAAAAAGEVEIAELLVAAGADPNSGYWVDAFRDGEIVRDWRSPLSMARRHERSAMIDYLEAVGAEEGP